MAYIKIEYKALKIEIIQSDSCFGQCNNVFLVHFNKDTIKKYHLPTILLKIYLKIKPEANSALNNGSYVRKRL